MSSPALAYQHVQAALAGHRIGHTLVYWEETASTNDEARRLAEAGSPDGTVVVAEHQTAGRGRRGSVWHSPPRQNLLLSVILRPPWPVTHWARLTPLAALAVAQAVEHVLPRGRAQVKWPNDIYLSDKKCAGLLLESVLPGGRSPFAVLGIGLNVNLTWSELPEELRPVTTSLRMENGGEPLAREAVLIQLLRALDEWTSPEWGGSRFATALEKVRTQSWLLGQTVRVRVGAEEFCGLAEDLGPEGELLVRVADGSRRVLTTVEWVRPVERVDTRS